MYKNQLQELAQRSCFNLPCYTCIREGPDHAPRFKATVSFNGEVFESPGYYTTLRQAEHAAAEVALSTLSQRGPTQSLAARILDETGVCKNLLQETAQRAGLSLPVYTTIRSGPKHLPLFKCIVEIGGRHFKGEPAKTKKQAEKNAATAAWSALNQSSTMSPLVPMLLERPESAENGDSLSVQKTDTRPSYQPSSSHSQLASRARVPITVRDRCRSNHEVGPRFTGSKQFLGNHSVLAAEGNADPVALGLGGGALYHTQASASSSRRQGRHHQRRHSLSGMESPMLSREAVAASRASAGGNMLGRIMLHHQQPQIRGLPYQSLSERFELKRPSLLEELQQREEEDDWLYQERMSSVNHRESLSSTSLFHSQGDHAVRMPRQSQSERFELKMHYLSPLEESHRRDEEEWLCGDAQDRDSSHERNLEIPYRHVDQWLQDGAALSADLKNNNLKEGWLRGDLLKQSSDVQKGHGYREGWFRTVGPQQVVERDRGPHLKQDHGYRSEYQEVWPSKAPVSGIVDHEQSLGQEHMLCKTLQRDKSAHITNSTPGTSSTSPFSSLWSKSAQWWGSHMPSTTSSAAAAVASSLGLRPPRSAAPVVKVRQMIPVCSAPPPRPPDTQGWGPPPHSRETDGTSESCQSLSKLRI
ncbi:hypothetical protein GOP47_0004778 [Adiantum capillus-veneris]|uniref:DRBM domain-containing protein n=1 Tax=Adiantum capillus-veneris TaxID=13818 RepID=A0A9D4ZKY4_ADICA|nr:hypothetical protein GOP47_0004778 [Adiantum capillus-veneris]